jgi:hypothetical protein
MRDDSPSLWVVLCEGALRQAVGGVRVMAIRQAPAAPLRIGDSSSTVSGKASGQAVTCRGMPGRTNGATAREPAQVG